MTAQDFARAMLDKALGFLLKQCQVRQDPKSLPLVMIYVDKHPDITSNNHSVSTKIVEFAVQDYVPSRSDCPGYEAPLEKTPRQIDGYSGDQLPGDNYYPSGERRPGGGETP